MGMIKELESKYPEGSNLTILNTFYQYQTKDPNTGKTIPDFLVIVYKNLDTDSVEYKIIQRPTYLYYVLKPEYKVPDYNMLFIERDKVDPVEVPYHKLLEDIAERTGNKEFFKNNIVSGNRQENQKLFTIPSILNADQDIQDHYRFRFAQTYQNNVTTLRKGFFDIEVDSKFSNNDSIVECSNPDSPINCLSFLDDSNNQVHTFILRDKRNPLIQIFEDKVKSGQINQNFISNFVCNAVGGLKKMEKYQLTDTKFNLYFYDYEIELLRDFFYMVHHSNVMVIEGWNSTNFDINYIIERIKFLGYDPADIMCDQSWPIKVVKNYVDERHINEFAERTDYTFISGTAVWMDQMIQYASRRKSSAGSYKSFGLDAIGELEAEVHKLDYSHITNSVIELPWLDFETFVLYNIMDVVVQKCIESVTGDLDYIVTKCLVNNTSYRKGHRQTVYLANRMQSDWYKRGLIIGCNVNKFGTKPTDKFPGALVHDPLKTSDYCKLILGDGRSIFVVDNLIDFDQQKLQGYNLEVA